MSVFDFESLADDLLVQIFGFLPGLLVLSFAASVMVSNHLFMSIYICNEQ